MNCKEKGCEATSGKGFRLFRVRNGFYCVEHLTDEERQRLRPVSVRRPLTELEARRNLSVED